MLSKRHACLGIIVFFALFISSCSGGKVAQSSTSTIVGGVNGSVYENGKILPGSAPLAPRGTNALYASGFTSSGEYLTCGQSGVVVANNTSWKSIGPDSSFSTTCSLYTQQQQNNNIYYTYANNDYNVSTYKNINGSWQQIGGFLPESGGANGITVNSSGNVFVGINSLKLGYGIVYTYNGSSWSMVTNAVLPDNSSVVSLAIGSGDKLYVAALNNAYNSSVYTISSGNQWESIPTAIPDSGNINSMVANNSGEIFIGTDKGHVYQLVNNTTWQQIFANTSGLQIEAMAVSQNNLYIATGDGYVYEYVNSSWNQLNTTQPPGYPIFGLSVSNTGTVVVISKDTFVYKLINSTTWQPMVTGGVSASPILTTYANNSTGMIYAAGIESSNESNYVYQWNGKQWSTVNDSPLPDVAGSSFVRMLASDSLNNLYALTFNNSVSQVFVSKNNSWQLLNNKDLPLGLGSSMILDKKSDNIYIALSAFDYLSKPVAPLVMTSVNGDWQVVNNTPITDQINGIGPIALDHNNNLYAATGGYFGLETGESSAVFESVAGKWLQLGPSVPNNEPVISMAIDQNNVIYVATFNVGGITNYLNNGNVYKLVNNNWVLANGALPPNSGGVANIQVDKNNNLYVLTMLGDVYTPSNGMWLTVGYYNMTSVALALN